LVAARSQAPFDVVLTDGLLPGRNGFQVAQAIRASPGGSRVGLAMFSGAFRGTRAQADAAHAGFDAYYAKPFVLTDLRDGLLALAARTSGKSWPLPGPSPGTASSTPAPAAQTVEARRSPGLVVPAVQRVDGVASTARVLLEASRARFDGVIELRAGDATTQVAYLGGVVVGVTDTMPEHALGAWLIGQGRISPAQGAALDARVAATNERVGEALVSLGFVSGPEALSMMEAQARNRLRRALVVQGEARATEGIEAARRHAIGSIDVVEQVLAVALAGDCREAAAAFVEAHGQDLVQRTVDFDSGIVAFARLRPQSLLPPALMAATSTVRLLSVPDPLEMYAIWVAGLVHVGASAPDAVRALPRAMASQGRGRVVNSATIDRVVSLVLRARGGHVYQLVDLPTGAPRADVLRCLTALNHSVGREALKSEVLGPAMPVARELWTMIEEGLFVFADERRRRVYDEDLLP
jgi:CheY-like chemotaxis protein